MIRLFFVFLLLINFLVAQQTATDTPGQQNSKSFNGETKVEGCVSKSAGDFILMKHDPGMSYQLHATGKIHLSHYLGQQVEVIGKESPSMSTSSSSSARLGSPSVALTITSIKTIEKRCSAQ
ncbi:MAG TPA: hypothetical protein VK828_14515 [Terriglobales bacterium]|jgi:hypothetical protein|nr:hypothetical protein [Terriglobales bacterium]